MELQYPPIQHVAPTPPPVPKIGHNSSGKENHNIKPFHLQGLQDDLAETGSVYSVYKQKIDKMFDPQDYNNVSNLVQVKIEKMFTEIGSEVSPASHIFSIDYLGSVPLHNKVTSLSGLQKPLRELYFAYKKAVKYKSTLTGKLEISSVGLKVRYQGDKGDLEQLNTYPTIAVWSAVKFVLQNANNSKKNSYAFLPLITDPDQVDKQSLFQDLSDSETKYIVTQNHAPIFAVVMRKIGLPKTLECHGFICQTSEDAIVIAATLYKSLMAHMKAHDKKPKSKNGVSCISTTSSLCADSIQNIPVRPPRKKRTSSVTSDQSSSFLMHEDNNQQFRKSNKNRRAPKIPTPNSTIISNYKRLPSTSKDLDQILPCPYEEPLLPDKPEVDKTHAYENEKEIEGILNNGNKTGEPSELKRTRSVRKNSADGILKSSSESGDILTKVTIPRSGSFLNAGGLTRYKSKINRTNGQAGGSPLGFHELFQEFRLQEGLTSIDEILAVIINPEGMSFNDLKPIYKEFLLKLAVTLTKDELYNRSRLIMKKQKKKLLRKNDKKRKRIIGVHGLKKVFRKGLNFNQINNRILKNKNKKKNQQKTTTNNSTQNANKNLPESSISTSSVDTRQFQPKENSNNKNNKKHSARRRNVEKKGKEHGRKEGVSTSEDSDFFTLKRNKKTSPNNQNRNSSSGYVSCSECSYDSDTCTCVSADKCYCSLGNRFAQHQGKPHHMKNHRPQTVQSCHSQNCRSDDKCYCSLNEKDNTLNTLTWCGCDTDSCAESNKCYCNNFISNKDQLVTGGTIFEQLKRRGFIPNTSQKIITPPHHRKKLCKKNSTTKSTRSVEYVSNPTEKYYEKLKTFRGSLGSVNNGLKFAEYLSENSRLSSGYHDVKLRADPGRRMVKNGSIPEGRTRSYSENIALDYEMFNDMGYPGVCNSKTCAEFNNAFVRSNSIYGGALSDVQMRNIAQYSVRSYKSYNGPTKKNGKTLQTSAPANRSNEALSVKKSAEIAALFTDLKLSQTTDITHLIPPLYNSQNMQNISSVSCRKFHKTSDSVGQNLHLSMGQKSGQKAIVTPYKHISNYGNNNNFKQIHHNTVYPRGIVQGHGNNINNNKSSLYSARNGLYTIQSQSDSSTNERPVHQELNKNKTNLENTLGYLP